MAEAEIVDLRTRTPSLALQDDSQIVEFLAGSSNAVEIDVLYGDTLDALLPLQLSDLLPKLARVA